MDPNSIDILLVEDSLGDAEFIIRELRRHKMADNLFHVKNGEEALDFLFATGKFSEIRDVLFPPKIVLLDIQMPKINGLEVLQRIKSDKHTKHTPVVILTSSNEDPDIFKCYELGVNSYIVKPVNFEEFTDIIRNIGFYWLFLNQGVNLLYP